MSHPARLLVFVTLSALGALAACGGDDPAAATGADASSSGSERAASSGTGQTGGAGGAGGHGAGGGGAEPVATTPDISVEAGGMFESESTIAVSSAGTIASAWIALGADLHIGYSFSSDDGATWAAPKRASPTDSLNYGDPTVVSTPDGAFYLGFIGFSADGFSDSHIFVAKAEPGATTFGPAVEASDPADPGPYDKPVLGVTKTGAVVLNFTNIASGALIVARTLDGATFTRAVAVDDDPFAALGTPCPDAESGRVWVVFRGDSTIGLRYSDDDGLTFPPANATVVSASNELDLSTDDPVCVGRGQDLWVAYTRSMDHADPSASNWKDYAIRLAHSTDGGRTFATRVDAHDPAAAAFYMQPALALERGGALDLTYYAGNMDDDPTGSLRLARSTDGGATFGPSRALAPLAFVISRQSPQWLGDYGGLAVTNARLYRSYPDNVGPAVHVSLLSVPLP